MYGLAFASLWVQVDGLIGSDGILPAAERLELAWEREGLGAALEAPSLFWLSSDDASLHAGCALGVIASVGVAIGVAPGPLLLVCWALYLSFASVGGIFLSYQWDTLLLETGLLACFFAPWSWRPTRAAAAPVCVPALWALRFLLFRLMFGSGLSKWASGDATWRDGTALEFHYWTQPLPAWTSYYAHQLPELAQRASVVATFAIELIAPLLIFGGARSRKISGAAIAVLMLAIAATGNYGFFNALTLVLCITLLDDDDWRRLVPARWRGRLDPPLATPPRRGRTAVVAGVLALHAFAGTVGLLDRVDAGIRWPGPVRELRNALIPWRSSNSYGLFGVMTTHRREIRVEGSRDRAHWSEYRFRWKPGPVDRAPAFVQPHMPRLDWQMWFAALGWCERNPWFVQFQRKLLEGSPAVTGLLDDDPFEGRPPRFILSRLDDYRFATEPGDPPDAWWVRRPLGEYCPVLTLSGGHLVRAP